mmetsp:Transcript_44609/g.111797  ORF Transcript_44609/g.111797 Transcript_44609/m.111797 type:complete len:299 (-) Transcript_44609:64-960(-)
MPSRKAGGGSESVGHGKKTKGEAAEGGGVQGGGTQGDGAKMESSAVGRSGIKGTDDQGRWFESHEALMQFQDVHAQEWYAANAAWWAEGGYGGTTDEEAMIGDELGQVDAEEGLKFLRALMSDFVWFKPKCAVDAGAGVGRMTKLCLLRVCETVSLLEADSGWLKRAKVYLGKKRAAKCTFTCVRLDELQALEKGTADLVWIQWTLQYLTDRHAVRALMALAAGLTKSGVLVIKENRPYGGQREDRFHMETPAGEQGRYDITRPRAHHNLLFQQAGLQILRCEEGVETHTYALALAKS